MFSSKRSFNSFLYSLYVSPGSIHCIFEKSNNHYSWKKVTTTVHNIIVGKLWIDQVENTVYLFMHYQTAGLICMSVTKSTDGLVSG